MSMRTFRGLGADAAVQPVDPAYTEEAFTYVFDVSLTAGQEKLDLALMIDGDTDFVWMATAGRQDGDYEIKFKLPNGRSLSSSRIRNTNCIGTAQFPVPKFPAQQLSAGGKLSIDIKDLSGSANTVQITLIGVKRFKNG